MSENRSTTPVTADLDPPDGGGGGAPSSGDGEGTRAVLLRAAIDLFGRQGFDGTSTREIARAAGVNIAGIAYHFGGKSGLHLACGEAIVAIVGQAVAAQTPPPGAVDELDPEAATERLIANLYALGRFMLGRPEAESVARFMVREQMDPSPTFEVLYGALMLPRHREMCRLFARATGEAAESEDVVIAVSALFGQMMFFRVGRATALRRLQWETIDGERVEKILAIIARSVRATVRARRAGRAGA